MYDVFVACDALSFPTCYVGMAFYSLCNVTTAYMRRINNK